MAKGKKAEAEAKAKAEEEAKAKAEAEAKAKAEEEAKAGGSDSDEDDEKQKTKPDETEKIQAASKLKEVTKNLYAGHQSMINNSPFQMNLQFSRIWEAILDLDERLKKLEG